MRGLHTTTLVAILFGNGFALYDSNFSLTQSDDSFYYGFARGIDDQGIGVCVYERVVGFTSLAISDQCVELLCHAHIYRWWVLAAGPVL